MTKPTFPSVISNLQMGVLKALVLETQQQFLTNQYHDLLLLD